VAAEAVSTVLRNLTGTDNFNISLSAYTLPNQPPRNYTSFTQASKEMGDARYARRNYQAQSYPEDEEGRAMP
jgi:hypothetical protein